MPINVNKARQLLKEFRFRDLFVEELGWDRHSERLDAAVDGQAYTLDAVVHKRGMAVFTCSPQADGRIPDYITRKKIEQQVAKAYHEHIIIFADRNRTHQLWWWVRREPGKPLAVRPLEYRAGQSGEPVIQKLPTIAFDLEEEDDLTIGDVTGRVRAAFDVEKVTKKFYDRFKTEHAAFLKFLQGIPDGEMQRWYMSVMLNRLMFIYFIQKKGFLNGDTDYLRNLLKRSQQRGKDRFYRDVLSPLFFEGFAKKESDRSPAARQLLGNVPYLNGGLFQRHQIEELHGAKIQIADAAFEQLFAFFEQYRWHLDERPLRRDDEINPDVLGYIFEKYINQKQMGAYYTKEDITEYISKNTVLPFLFDVARQKCRIAFEGEQSVWRLLQTDPDRYIYDAVRHGVEQPLPDEIAAGIHDVSKRSGWNKSAPEEYALPTEIWREVVARHQRYEDLWLKMSCGEVRDINDLITHNLNIRQFAQDVIENSEGPELLRAFWKAIQEVTILDPTCGSGAFLFAALNILEPLYEACLRRMEAFLEELARADSKPLPQKYDDFRKVLDSIRQHPNERYFILKSIIVNNLYGVDIMDEAVEICKLRLFLKLVAQVEDAGRIEPLPDIDFNIRAGNTLVGYATYNEVRQAVLGGQQMKMDLDDDMVRIDEKAQDAAQLFHRFQEMQDEQLMNDKEFAKTKSQLWERLRALEDELNRYLAREYGVDTNSLDYATWLGSHKPFHWFIEFYRIVAEQGGFDVIIGNPPYVEYKDVKSTYTIQGYETMPCGDLYAYTIERSYRLARLDGRIGVIVPISIFGTDGFQTLQVVSLKTLSSLWVSYFANRPSQLFDGAQKRITILLGSKGASNVTLAQSEPELLAG